MVLCASTKHTDYRIRARKIITGGLFEKSTYTLKVSDVSAERLNKIFNRRKDNYSYLFTCLSPEKCLGKTPNDFIHCFTRGSLADHVDDNHMKELFSMLLFEMDIDETHIFDEETSEKFYLTVLRTIEYNKTRLGLLIKQIEDEELIFGCDFEKDTWSLHKKLKSVINDNKVKTDILNYSICIIDGIKNNMDFEIITADSYFTDSRKLKKIHNVVTKLYGNEYDTCIKPLYEAYGYEEKQERVGLRIRIDS